MNVYHTRHRLAQKRLPTLALKPRGDVTRSPKQGYQWPQKRTYVLPKNEMAGYVTVGLYEVVGLVSEVAGGSLVADHPLTSLQREHVIHRGRSVNLESLP